MKNLAVLIAMIILSCCVTSQVTASDLLSNPSLRCEKLEWWHCHYYPYYHPKPHWPFPRSARKGFPPLPAGYNPHFHPIPFHPQLPPDRRFQHEPLPPVSLLRPAPLLTAATSLSPVYPLLHSGLSVDSAEQRFVLGERTLSGNLVAPPPRSPEPPDPPVPPDLLHSPLNRTSTHPYRPFRSMNTQLDRYVPNLALRAGMEICFVDVQPFLFTSGGLSTRFMYEIRRHCGVEAKLNQICLAGRVYCSTVLAAPCFSTAIHVDLLPTGNDNTTTASISLRRSIPVSISIMCALQQRFSLVLWTTTTSPTGRGGFDLSSLSGEKSENDWCDIPLSKTLYWNFKSKFRHFRPSGHCYGVSQLLTAMLSDLFEIHIVSSESSVGVSTDFAGLMRCSATSSSSTGSFAVQTYLLGLFNVESDYFLLAAVSIVSRVQVKSFQRFLYFEQVSLCNIYILCVIVLHLLLVTLSSIPPVVIFLSLNTVPVVVRLSRRAF
ncbi:hypothetical protein HID58_088897 [Brassica napus]|uniref:Uncharacterized protein n=1 Tax=Brassica napus TaxID=3708 RepID=A0ABQ7Y018_BRANA|nr:hypothetical protein HID58_088897 [Brassica napus]